MKELLYLKDEQIKDLIEKLFYAYRETFADPKKVLKKHSKHHTKKHMSVMKKAMKKGKTFNQAHKKAMRKVGK